MKKHEQVATFGAGCFWCIQHDFDHLEGVLTTRVGYTGGSKSKPTYEEVCTGLTGHVEAIEVRFDPEIISYDKILDFYFRHIDPKEAQGQFCDIGSQYRPVVFFHDLHQKLIAENYINALNQKETFGLVAVKIEAAQIFYAAEDYHQHFYKKNSSHYEAYRRGSGRDQKLDQIWNH